MASWIFKNSRLRDVYFILKVFETRDYQSGSKPFKKHWLPILWTTTELVSVQLKAIEKYFNVAMFIKM